MKIETLLDAYYDAKRGTHLLKYVRGPMRKTQYVYKDRQRQAKAFRTRILTRDKNQRLTIDDLKRESFELYGDNEAQQQKISDMNWVISELSGSLNSLAEKAYQEEVLDTGMESMLIGGANEYADKEDWIEYWLDIELDAIRSDDK